MQNFKEFEKYLINYVRETVFFLACANVDKFESYESDAPPAHLIKYSLFEMIKETKNAEVVIQKGVSKLIFDEMFLMHYNCLKRSSLNNNLTSMEDYDTWDFEEVEENLEIFCDYIWFYFGFFVNIRSLSEEEQNIQKRNLMKLVFINC